MASRQNREMRAEYPTGHNKGIESPSRRVPRVYPGANPVEPPEEVDVKAYGTPIGPPEVSEEDQAARLAEREAKLGQEGTPEERKEAIETHITEGIDETLRADLETQADARTGAPEEKSPTADLSARGAAANIEEMKRRTEEAGR